MGEGYERRRHLRVPMAKPLTLKVTGSRAGSAAQLKAECVDMSFSGLRCRGALPAVSPGLLVQLSLLVPTWMVSRTLKLSAIIKRVDTLQGEWALQFRPEGRSPMRRLRSYVGRALRAHEQLEAACNSESGLSEAFRMVPLSLGAPVEGRARVVLITSSVSGEGKSFVAAGLAMALAEGDQRVLLVDADLHRPTLHRWFHVAGGHGLAQMLGGGLPQETRSFIAQTRSGIDLMPAGSSAGSPPDLCTPERLGVILERLRRSGYRWIVVDSPPLLSAAEATALALAADDVLLSVRSAVSREQEVQQARALLERRGVSVRGVVLTDYFDITKGRGYSNGIGAPRREPRQGNEIRGKDSVTKASTPARPRSRSGSGIRILLRL